MSLIDEGLVEEGRSPMMVEGWNTFRSIRRALASSHWRPERLRRLQETQLRTLLAHAYQNVPLYRALYDEAGFRPETFRSLDDVVKIPILTKQRLKAAAPDEVVARGIDPARCATVATSGSTGTPLRIFLKSRDERWQRAVAWRILFEHGFRWTDRTLEIRMTPGRTFLIQRLGLAPKMWVSIQDPPQSWALRLAQTAHDVIVASAGTLHALAEAVEVLGCETPRPRIVISDSETLAPATRRLVRSVLGSDPVDVFGLVECSNFAWECEHRNGFHVSADSHIVEVAAPEGEQGSIIATALGMWTMPIIRYDTGDLAEIQAAPCACGRSLPLLRRIYGRAVDSVLLPDGSRLFWPVFHEVLGGYTDLRQWRIVQENACRLTVQLAVPARNGRLLTRLDTDLRRVLPDGFRLDIERVERISVNPGEKTRMIVSKMIGPDGAHPAVGSRR
ncbi:MAG: phenylacetate--CoA ligase family protein [Nitrospiraceae bacterium]